MLKFLRNIIIFLILAVVAVLGYLGFLPGVSDVLGTSKPRDLGISYTAADLASAKAKLGIAFSILPAARANEPSIAYSGGTRPLNALFASQEMTALYHAPRWYYAPFTNITLKANADGTAEASGLLRTDRLAAYAKASGLSAADADIILQQLKLLPAPPAGGPPFYLKGRLEIANNKVTTLDLTTLELGRFSLPLDTISGLKTELMGLIESRIKSVPGLDIKSLRVDDGRLAVKATVPAAVSVAKDITGTP